MVSIRMYRRDYRADEISKAIMRIQTGGLTVACALIGGLGLFAMTAWLLIKGGPQVGAHLRLLAQYFIGYSVTWPGSLVGFFYGALLGGLIGGSVSKIYNAIVGFRSR